MPRDASVYQRAGRPVWYCSFFDAGSLRRRHVATSFRVDSPQGEKRALEFAAKKSAEAGAVIRAPSEAWDQWVDAWLVDRFGRSPRTLGRYQTAWAHVRVFVNHAKIPVPAAVTRQDVHRFIVWRTEGCPRPVTRNTAITDARAWGSIMSEALRRGWIDTNPVDRLGLQRDQPHRKPEITDREVQKIRLALAAREGHLPITERWMSVSFEIALHQGCRFRETAVPMAAIDLVAGTISFVAKASKGRKNEFTTALHPSLRPLIAELHAARAMVTCTHPKHTSALWHKFFKELHMGHLCFHCTRVTVITRLARAGVPISQAMRFVGHASEQVHQIYQRLQTPDLGACTAALASLGAATDSPPQNRGGLPTT